MRNLFQSLFDHSSRQEPSENRIHLATCAVLVEIAYIDGEFAESERAEIISILKTKFSLSDEHIEELIKSAEEEIKKSIDVWRFSSQINKSFERSERIQLVEMIWKLVLVDGYMESHEEYLANKVAGLLGLTPREMNDAKRSALVSK